MPRPRAIRARAPHGGQPTLEQEARKGLSLQLRPPEPLAASHRLDDFECGEAVLDDWPKRRALANQSSGASRIVVATDQDGFVCGYYALAAGAVS